MRKALFLLWIFVCSATVFGQQTTEGTLYAAGRSGNELGACPLKRTAVKVDISGFLSRVNVRQEFQNSFSEPIEAVYVFPLSHGGAVDAMTMTVGDRVIRGRIMRREAARQTYDAAKTAGKRAALLDQERDNIFTQSVANIMPGETVVVEISYVETLKYEDGAYEFVFPMTVAPRYIPGGVKDASRISQPVIATRNGSDVTIEVNLNAGVPVEVIRSPTHDIDQLNLAPNLAKVSLRSETTIPNKDFILRYDVTGSRIEDALLTHRDKRGGFFTLILQPPDKIATEDRTPKEIVFVLDTSGSMSGFPIEKAKEAMKLSLDGLYPDDTFNLITFAGDTAILFDRPVPATYENLALAQQFLAERQGYGGTEMMKAIKAALEPSDAADHLRIVCFMTDGEIGNDDEIVAEIKRHPNARIFSFGIGSSVNRSLLDRMANEGKGEAEYVGLNDDGSKAAKRFYERVRTPLLTDLSIDWSGMPVADVYPSRLTDLFSAKPVILHGRYTGPAAGTIKLRGKVAGQPYERSINVNLPDEESANDVLATLWARTRISELTSASLNAPEKKRAEAEQQIADIGIEFALMTSFTSFVAVEESVANPNGDPVKVAVPSELPEGMDPRNADTFFRQLQTPNSLTRPPAVSYGAGIGSGNGQGSINAVVNVTSGSLGVAVDTTDSKISTNITAELIEKLPTGVSFSSALKVTPTAMPAPMTGGFILDGESGAENVFVLDGQEVTGYRGGTLANGRNAKAKAKLDGSTQLLVVPDRPKVPNGMSVTGRVTIVFEADARGQIAKINESTGDKRLVEMAEAALRLTRFTPVKADGKPVRITGTMVYEFGETDIDIGIRNARAIPATAGEMKAFAIGSKLHFWLFDLVMRLRDDTLPVSANESRFVHDGMADISITSRSASSDAVRRLEKAGLIVKSQSGKQIDGSIAVDKLADLAALDDVVLILPRL